MMDLLKLGVVELVTSSVQPFGPFGPLTLWCGAQLGQVLNQVKFAPSFAQTLLLTLANCSPMIHMSPYTFEALIYERFGQTIDDVHLGINFLDFEVVCQKIAHLYVVYLQIVKDVSHEVICALRVAMPSQSGIHDSAFSRKRSLLVARQLLWLLQMQQYISLQTQQSFALLEFGYPRNSSLQIIEHIA